MLSASQHETDIVCPLPLTLWHPCNAISKTLQEKRDKRSFAGCRYLLKVILDKFVDCKFINTLLYTIYSPQICPKLLLKAGIKEKNISTAFFWFTHNFAYHIFI